MDNIIEKSLFPIESVKQERRYATYTFFAIYCGAFLFSGFHLSQQMFIESSIAWIVFGAFFYAHIRVLYWFLTRLTQKSLAKAKVNLQEILSKPSQIPIPVRVQKSRTDVWSIVRISSRWAIGPNQQTYGVFYRDHQNEEFDGYLYTLHSDMLNVGFKQKYAVISAEDMKELSRRAG